jgi:hypothetical protein
MREGAYLIALNGEYMGIPYHIINTLSGRARHC